MPIPTPPDQPQEIIRRQQPFPPLQEAPQPPTTHYYGDRLAWRPYFPAQADQGTQRVSSNWLSRLVVFVLFVSGVVIGIVYREELFMCLALMADISSPHPEAQIKGFMVLGFLGVVLVAIVRILVSSNKKNNNTSCPGGRDEHRLL